MKEKKLDARIKKTVMALEEAILGIASEQDLAAVSVAEVTRQSGINRSTFYAHATSPMEILISVLSRELDDVLSIGMVELRSKRVALKDNAGRTLKGIVGHILEREKIYRSTNVLREVLTQKILSIVMEILEQKLAHPPSKKKQDLEIYAAYTTYGVVGAIEAWMAQPGKRKPEVLINGVLEMYPAWFGIK